MIFLHNLVTYLKLIVSNDWRNKSPRPFAINICCSNKQTSRTNKLAYLNPCFILKTKMNWTKKEKIVPVTEAITIGFTWFWLSRNRANVMNMKSNWKERGKKIYKWVNCGNWLAANWEYIWWNAFIKTIKLTYCVCSEVHNLSSLVVT